MTTLVIADPGADHLGSLGRMYTLVDAAKDAGADVFKPQLYRGDTLYADEGGRSAVRPYEMPLWWLPLLKRRCDLLRMQFMCSAFSKELYDEVNPLVGMHKIASLEAGDDDLVRHVVAYGKPVIASTGAATQQQIEALLAILGPVAVMLQCTTSYPAPIEDSDLAAIGGLLYGLSDHTRSAIAGAVAVARGATVVEKHITLGDGRSSQSPDFPHSFDPTDFRYYVKCIRETELLLGSDKKTVRPSEQPLAQLRRKPGKLRGEAA